jgi:ActR/RegA family two-component response regulator
MHKSFLFVSPDPEFGTSFERTLKGAGMHVMRADGAAEAVDLLERWVPDSILVDGRAGNEELIAALRNAAGKIGADFWVLNEPEKPPA